MGRAKRNPSLGRPGKRWVSPLALPILRCHFLCPEPDRRGGVYRISTGCSLHSSTLPSRPYRRRPSQCLPGARSPASTCARQPTSGCCGSVEIFQYTAVPGPDRPYSPCATVLPSSSTSSPDRAAPSLNALPATSKLQPTLAPDTGAAIQAIAGVVQGASAFAGSPSNSNST